MSKEPEIGQMIFGNPTGDYGTPCWADSFVDSLLNEIERVFWNKNQEQWSRYEDPKLNGIEYRSYYWGDDNEESQKPNLKFSHSPQEIRWYKHPGRGQSSSIEMSEKEWCEWYKGALEVISKNEPNLY